MVVIESSVGAGGVNKKKDVKIVQILLNSQAKAEKLITDGLCGSKTIGAIFSYQRTIMPGGSLMVELIRMEELFASY
ncbi:hypothetical protein [Vibrio parahaemolyticus]|uniref:hypothetical protein n=1 Tax=Vibrio parahaemolyticus TaxID=670 RepID=UPI001F27C1E4|nr:hypothetical protein [Vibrio parahaemolyticus]